MPPKKSENIRDETKQFYYFVVGVELFSRYAFVELIDRNKLKGEKVNEDQIESLPSENQDAVEEQINLFKKKFQPNAEEVKDIYKKWFKEIADMGYILCNVVSDNGTEFVNQTVNDFLKNGADGIFDKLIDEFNDKTKEYRDSDEDLIKKPYQIGQGTTIPNDRVANPIAERFIQTFKRLWGQHTTMNPKQNYNQSDVDEIVKFYNDRVHSSTGYSPDEVLKGVDKEFVEDTLFDLYLNQKGHMYFEPYYEPIEVGKYVRIYTKWNVPDKNIGDKKSNVNNYSWTVFKIKDISTGDKSYTLQMVSAKDGSLIDLKKFTQGQFNTPQYKDYIRMLDENKDKRDSKLPIPFQLRQDQIRQIDFDAFQKYNTYD